MSDRPGGPEPGWYHDRHRPGWLRWWNGTSWVDSWQPDQAASAVTPIEASASSGSPSRSRLLWVVAGAVALTVAGAAVLVAVSSNGDSETRSTPSFEFDGSAADDDADDPIFDDADDVPPSGGDPDEGSGEPGSGLINRCAESDWLSIPGTDIAIEPLNLEQEIDIGARVRADVVSLYTAAPNHPEQPTLDALLDLVAPSDSAIPFSVTVLDSDEVNAFAIPGGDLFFTTGIIDLMTRDELAFVMGHEVAHVVCRHIAQGLEREALVAAGIDGLFGSDLSAGDYYAGDGNAVLATLNAIGFSKDDELESDLVAVALMRRAGLDLRAAVSALRALRDLEGSYDPSAIETFFSTHPPTEDRIAAVEQAVGG